MGTPPFGGRRPQYFSGMTKAQVDSIVRASQFAGDIGNRFADRGTGGLAIPPPGSPLRGSYDARLANMGPSRRIIVADPPPDARHQALADAGTQLMGALRTALGANQRYVVISRDSTAGALRSSRNRDSVMHLLNADMNVSIRGYQSANPDSVRWIITLVDPTSQLHSQTVSVGPVALGATASLADSVSQLSMRMLWQLDHSPRRGAVAAPGSPPTAPTPPAPAAPIKKP
jgi:hypothetical protein